MSTTTSNIAIIHAYRHLHQHLLRAAQYSKPARYIVRDRLREAFRTCKPKDYDAARIARTLEFLNGAAKTTGLEHKIVKNWVHAWWGREKTPGMSPKHQNYAIQKEAYAEFDRTIEKLNESMGLCIR
ncbi:unnamed protein product [Zymoseptoria tritici ST99CH_3D1]|nr:unnamed protein product [Zymoseptoria tritici ST99CH_3D1]